MGTMAEEDATALSYEEMRKQRVEENKKRMGELGLFDLAKSLPGSKGDTSPKKSVKRKVPSLEEAGAVSRRSSRVAALPSVTYNDAPVFAGVREKVETRHGLGKQYLSDKPRMAAIDAAEVIFKDLRNPAFIKAMLNSHTSGGFWLGMPHAFCKQYLPIDSSVMWLEANGCEWECLYLVNKGGLSGGWRGFSIDNDLRDGDCCIFELVNPQRFLLHIFRVSCDENGKAPQAKKGKTNKKSGKR